MLPTRSTRRRGHKFRGIGCIHCLGGREVMNGLFGCIPTMRIPFGDDRVYFLSPIPSTCQQQKRLPKNERKTVRERVFY